MKCFGAWLIGLSTNGIGKVFCESSRCQRFFLAKNLAHRLFLALIVIVSVWWYVLIVAAWKRCRSFQPELRPWRAALGALDRFADL